jgi:glutamine amidotransferase
VIAIVDVGISNTGSVRRMLEYVGAEVRVATQPSHLEGATKLILPGVGHFDHGMGALAAAGFVPVLKELVTGRGMPLLGICLGMQLLCHGSEEGVKPGLAFVDADVRRFTPRPDEMLRIPHMGWNVVSGTASARLLPPSEGERRFYFVHSYKVVPRTRGLASAYADYGGDFCAAFERGNVYGVQFHPEKSHRFGVELISRFVAL